MATVLGFLEDSGRVGIKLRQAEAGYLRQVIVFMTAKGAIDQPVVILDVEGQFVDYVFHFVERIDQVITIKRLWGEHGDFSVGRLDTPPYCDDGGVEDESKTRPGM